ncbi:F0F1 ATP synthase subunit delta [Mesomycoplasma lagogenitalium]|uniref:ATP synthase subunit delta n=1 Tax=Mesomycoplasma lagogenitalium TaxID=171286 RepID=A0ABY8LSL5_9BACT|nr:F0F1 ATP synthase subunit delta [Mesomycoplasma lagogenitalium]WGI36250.1 F0F1 ATP synthase subunit delta [Mesomycoplasma lagogenitalium]
MTKNYYLGYANALFEIANEEDKLDLFYEQCQMLEKIFKNHINLITLLKSFNVSKEEKEKIIDNIFENKIDLMLINFIKLLTKKMHIFAISDILKEFEKIVLKSQNIQKGIVYSVNKLKISKMNEVKKFIEKKLNSKVILKNVIDKSLIAGIKIVIGDYIFENSITSHLEQIKNYVLKGGE